MNVMMQALAGKPVSVLDPTSAPAGKRAASAQRHRLVQSVKNPLTAMPKSADELRVPAATFGRATPMQRRAAVQRLTRQAARTEVSASSAALRAEAKMLSLCAGVVAMGDEIQRRAVGRQAA